MTALCKIPFVESVNRNQGAWGFRNDEKAEVNYDGTSISDDFYALVVPNRPVAKLDDLEWHEEREFWELTFAVARNTLETSSEKRLALFGVNDGMFAGQSIPHVHSHITMIDPSKDPQMHFDFAGRDMARTFDDLGRKFRRGNLMQLDRRRLFCNFNDIAHFTEILHYTRMRMRDQVGADNFRIYTGSAMIKELSGMFMVVDGCSAEAPQVSFSQVWRALHGRMPMEKLDCKFGYGKYSHFEMKQP